MSTPVTDQNPDRQTTKDTSQGSTNPSARQTVSSLANDASIIRKALQGRSLVFVGIMGVGKSTIGRRVAQLLEIPFLDSDTEIEQAANLTIPEIFEKYGEAYFREGERKVIERLLNNNTQVLATGGGAFMDEGTRKKISKSAVSIWLDADINLIMQRVKKRKTRPLLKQPNPRSVIEDLLKERNPFYAQADLKFQSQDATRDKIAANIVTMLSENIDKFSLTDNQ